MYIYLFALLIMAGSFDDNDFSLSGLTQEGHELNVTVISDSDESDDNLTGLFECAKSLETGVKKVESSKCEDSMVVTEQVAEANAAKVRAEGDVVELVSGGLRASKRMASSMVGKYKNFDVE